MVSPCPPRENVGKTRKGARNMVWATVKEKKSADKEKIKIIGTPSGPP
jgi:hypothetical protein